MSIACNNLAIYKTDDNIQLGFRVRGDEFLHWFEDTSGNPVVMDKGKPRYADWSATKKEFVPSEYVTKESRRRHLKDRRHRPTSNELLSARMDVMNNFVHIEGAEANPVVEDEDDVSEYIPTVRSSPPGISRAGIASGTVRRPIMLIYVRFANSTGASIPDSYLTDITFNKSKFGTLAHYFDTQFNGAVELVNLGVYRVTLPTNGKNFGSGGTTITDIWIPVLNDLFTKQGIDFRTFGTNHIDTYGFAPKRIDRSSFTPIIILHGQEEATGNTGSCSVWGHAYPNGTGIVIKNDGTVANTLGNNAYHLKNAAIFGAFHGPNYFNLGIIAHECGHGLLDLYDLYDVSTGAGEDDINGFGVWSLMAYNWTFTSSNTQLGSTPPNLDGYSLWRFNHKMAKAITTSGPQVLDSPFVPHVIRMSGVNSEAFIVQSRGMTGYDEGPAYYINLTTGVTPSPGVLIMHYNPSSSSEANKSATDMVAMVVEAHGGVQNLRQDSKVAGSNSNAGDARDLFGTATRQVFGDAVSDPDNKLISENPGRLGLFDMTAIVGNSDGSGSYNIQFNPDGGTDPHWEDLPDDPEDPEASTPVIPSDNVNWNDPYRHAVRHGISSSIENALQHPVPYPYSILQIRQIAGASVNRHTGALTIATSNGVFTARLIVHRLVSTYKDVVIGDGIDIYVGKVLRNKPKIVNVKFFNEDDNLAQLHTIKIEIVPSWEYKYYDMADLSLDGVSWSKSITYNRSQLLSTKSGANQALCTFDFFAKVETDTTVSDPKPIQVKVTYVRVLP